MDLEWCGILSGAGLIALLAVTMALRLGAG
jgi:hypothetical protein